MTANAMNVWGEISGIVIGAAVLLVFGILLALMVRRPSVPPGSKGRREKGEEGTYEVIAADGYIDSFAGVIEEAGGSLTPLVYVALVAIPLWWLVYIILNWSPYLINIITLNQSTYRP